MRLVMRSPRLAGRLLTLALLVPTPAFARDRGGLTILSYHEIADKADALTPAYAVAPTMFLRQMDWLRNHGYHFVSVDDLVASRAGRKALPDKAVLVTFDDAYQSVFVHAWPVLKMFRIPAVVSVVGSWLEPKERIDVDGKVQPRAVMISWEALREMVQSGLVEVGSHSWDLHRGVPANPQGNLQPAATSRRWVPERHRYEDEPSYRARIETDLARSIAEIRRRTGKAPRVIAWPYGRFNATTVAIAERLGFRVGLTLEDGTNDPESTPLMSLRRLIVQRELTLPGFVKELDEEDLTEEDRPQTIAHVDLDAIYDADPAQQERNLAHLLDRLQWLNVNTVYLQAFADPDANGSADAVYFPCRRLPVRADLFNRVAWQIRTRTQVRRLYAWIPALAFELPPDDPAANDVVTALPAAPGETAGRVDMGYRRLSPFSPRASGGRPPSRGSSSTTTSRSRTARTRARARSRSTGAGGCPARSTRSAGATTSSGGGPSSRSTRSTTSRWSSPKSCAASSPGSSWPATSTPAWC
jgi:biofilm PGA synthesis lipoprotein PgaB